MMFPSKNHRPSGGADVGEFGEKLRKQREQRGITLEAVSNTTKIGTRMLKALEDERFDQLPGGVFNKGFVRAYARQIGLDAEEAVNDYLAALRESQVQAQAIMPDFRSAHLEPAEQFEAASAPGNEISETDPQIEVQTTEVQKKEVRKDARQDEHEAPQPVADREATHQKEEPPFTADEAPKQKTAEHVAEERPRRKLIVERPAQPKFKPAVRIPWGIVAAGLLLVALLLAFLSYHPRHEGQVEQKAEQKADQRAKQREDQKEDQKDVQKGDRNAASQPANSAGESPAASPSIPPAATSPAPTAPVARPNAAPAPSAGVPAASSGASAASSNPAPGPVTATARNDAPDTSSSTVHSATPAAGSPPARAKAPREFTLRIRAEETSWVSITADGKPVAQETLIAPAGTSVRATQEIVVRTRNAGGLLFVLNGKTLPRQGASGESRTFLFDATGMHLIVR